MIPALSMLSRVPMFVWSGLAVALIAGAMMLGLRGEIRALERQNAAYAGQVADLTERLTTCRGSVATLEASIADQNARITRMADAARARMQAAEQAVADARRQAGEAAARAERLLARPIAGNTVCERVMDFDRTVMEALQ